MMRCLSTTGSYAWAARSDSTASSPDATPLLARVVALLAPARVRVHYPGVWLSPAVWATHGHYLDRHLLPESTFGIARGLLGRLPRDGAAPVDYESAGGPSLTRFEALMTRWLPRPLAAMFEDLADLVRAATMPRVPTNLLPRDIAPLTSILLGLQMRRASLPALARVVHRLGVVPIGSSSGTCTGSDRCPATIPCAGRAPEAGHGWPTRVLGSTSRGCCTAAAHRIPIGPAELC